MKKILLIQVALMAWGISFAQSKPDTIIVELAKTSKLVFTMNDRNDLKTLRQYDFQGLFDDMLNNFDDSSKDNTDAYPFVKTDRENNDETIEQDEDGNASLQSDEKNRRTRSTYQSFNFDFGVNNYLSNGKFPDNQDQLYAVRPWGSWYVAVNSIEHTHVAGPFFIEWGAGVSWYNFKFQQDDIAVSKNENGVVFAEDNRDVDYIKSKLTATYLNASFIPMFDFLRHSASTKGSGGRKYRCWNSCDSNFRFGVGPYAGYRLGSYSKLVFENEDVEKERNRDNFYLNNFRYGVRLQFGISSMDFFFNYDLNKLFNTNKPANPDLNAFSFGVTF
jgi:hypothetical protein